MHRTELIIFPLTVQTINIAPMMSLRKGGYCTHRVSRYSALDSRLDRREFISDIAIFVLKRDVKLQLTNWPSRVRFLHNRD